ncbi:MAG TPA: hypothetical protein PK765_01010, partial [bacterium]|nr:hypothetical protein [bacterium]
MRKLLSLLSSLSIVFVASVQVVPATYAGNGANVIPTSSTVLMTSCPNGWINNGIIAATVAVTSTNIKPVSFATNFYSCTSPGGNIPTSSTVLMTSCPNGWTNNGIIAATVAVTSTNIKP